MFTKTRSFNPSFINTIQEDEIYHGNWWLPIHPDDKVSGVLTLSKTAGIKLNLIGMFKHDSSETLGHTFADHDIILGSTLPGNGLITIVNCKERQRESSSISNTVDGSVQRFNGEYLLMGHHTCEYKNLKFSKFEFSTTYLTDWMNSKQVEIDFVNDEQTIVSTLPNKEFVIQDEGFRVILTSWASTSLGGSYNSSQHSSITIELDKAITFKRFQEDFYRPLIDLVQFGSSLLNSITFLNILPIGANKWVKMIPTNEFDQIKRAKEPVHRYTLFLLSDLTEKNDFILNWLNFHRNTQHIFSLYFDSLHIGFQFPVTKFLNIVQSTESYHAERTKDDNIKLRMRLQDLLIESDDLLAPIISNQNAFISRTIHTRNYYTHYNPKKRNKAASGIELLCLTYALRLLLDFHLLLACKLEKTQCKQLIIENSSFSSVKQLVNENDFWKD